jgi:hypothetical protein
LILVRRKIVNKKELREELREVEELTLFRVKQHRRLFYDLMKNPT